MKKFSLYVHIPFCYHKCPYCDFNTYAVSSIPEREYLAGLLAELEFRTTLPEWRGKAIQTIYFGGGTPSLFSPSSIRKIIACICRSYAVEDDVEISLEANPGTVSFGSLEGFKESGINRLSFGAQSFNRDFLKTLGRMHSPEQVESSVEAAKNAGFYNINLDLIYGIPGQKTSDFREDIEEALKLDPQHISAYGLTIEKGTPFYTSYKKGHLVLPTDELVEEMMEEVNSCLPSRGFNRYEISNFALTGRQARHNLAYWDGDDYLGIGAGAHSFCGTYQEQGSLSATRWANYAIPNRYMREATTHGSAESWNEELTREDLMFEVFFLGLRKTEGISLKRFEVRFGKTVNQEYPALVEVLSDQGFVQEKDGFLSLTERGLMVADSVIENFSSPEKISHHIPPTEMRKVANA